eukprot:CAMPEP_0174721646 /NCGR_PEP_ID=MMETSP1094-20130205/36763_1 /TAXON_ID=156173 /ORGANISM="Chrysochromulina brevifilum, Strain UTEX LB 985" /LENGTH=93 /DNA_ID=CAMNT_0015922375 /DNA_START=525 /DNA_END=802 /DNA_ORIENTATION=+
MRLSVSVLVSVAVCRRVVTMVVMIGLVMALVLIMAATAVVSAAGRRGGVGVFCGHISAHNYAHGRVCARKVVSVAGAFQYKTATRRNARPHVT